MKMKVIFSPYCNLATIGFSEIKLDGCQLKCLQAGETRQGNAREHPAPDREGQRDDEKHEESHLCYQEQEDLRGSVNARSW